MSGPDSQTLQIRASAAAWLARLRSESRTSEDEAAFREWLSADVRHASAFETMNAVWEAARAARRDLRGVVPRIDRRVDRRVVIGGVAVAAGLGATLLLTEMAEATTYKTKIGEQKHVSLSDGSKLFLDTNTKVTVSADRQNRKAALEYGCASFRLAADSSRPYLIDVGDNIVEGNQLTLDTRRDGDTASILLLQGRATVKSGLSGAVQAHVLNGGDRLISVRQSVKLDKPDLLPLLAWHTGHAIFQDETLVQAAQEMNRYSMLRLEITDPRIRGLKVSGVYRVGDNLVFALALASLLPVTIRPYDDRIEIVGDDKKLRQI